ncbi:hypothetical protein AVI51_15215 [Piscirickettsia salmonis]|uniref:hypothetical protein n=1 Tax=Piscirickettsia salmonis TaxID=1238 RepID=UPI0006874067|nr:hypothetical protein [Piscirickettsia salmonis]APS44751.1 hypothetical protein AVI48_10500 [Piscirickettsia salmonis]APS48111.1 hypothetical protein AVI49_11105 [Piscirickettsia salmonis]APS52067.1 hypothetical protein AVI50_15370 [Piscirickettsia salmonis]APS55285.1 hypothetical protein AVI51_15215 [Piscirickettsia salmonis]APS58414.1 hypothetical protein AVI52_14980 [Piscirickettsia salmonis]
MSDLLGEKSHFFGELQRQNRVLVGYHILKIVIVLQLMYGSVGVILWLLEKEFACLLLSLSFEYIAYHE